MSIINSLINWKLNVQLVIMRITNAVHKTFNKAYYTVVIGYQFKSSY